MRTQEYVFSGCTVPPDSKGTELGSSDQEASPSAGKIRVVFLLFSTLKYVSTAISCGVDISAVPGCHLLRQITPQ